MKIFTRAYMHFYNDLTKAYTQLIDDYSTDNSMDINFIIDTYGFPTMNIKEISYLNTTDESNDEIVRSTVYITDMLGIKRDILDIPLKDVINIYEIIVFYLLCVEYGINYTKEITNVNEAKKRILEKIGHGFDDGISGTVQLMADDGISENSSTIEYTLQALSLLQHGKTINAPDDFNDDDYIKEQLTVKMTMIKRGDDYFFNAQHEMFDIDLPVQNMSPGELLSMYDTVIKNKKTHFD